MYLHSLYDLSLSFEHSPLIGCTSFALTGDATEGGHSVLARNFDFEAGDIFDSHKAVFLVRESGQLAYASVAWPGLIGALTGMNEEGLALVVHGGRAGEARNSGEPLVHTMRDVLGEARSTEDAVRMLATREPMVSHIVMLVDAGGQLSRSSSARQASRRTSVAARAGWRSPTISRGPGRATLEPSGQRPKPAPSRAAPAPRSFGPFAQGAASKI